MCPKSSTVTGGASSSIYLLNCTVCKGEFYSKPQWEHHLIQNGHQKLARIQDNLNDKNNLRECSLVIFTTYDLTEEWADKIVQYFGKDSIVTDFVWWEDRPRLGIVQFESRSVSLNLIRYI